MRGEEPEQRTEERAPRRCWRRPTRSRAPTRLRRRVDAAAGPGVVAVRRPAPGPLARVSTQSSTKAGATLGIVGAGQGRGSRTTRGRDRSQARPSSRRTASNIVARSRHCWSIGRDEAQRRRRGASYATSSCRAQTSSTERICLSVPRRRDRPIWPTVRANATDPPAAMGGPLERDGDECEPESVRPARTSPGRPAARSRWRGGATASRRWSGRRATAPGPARIAATLANRRTSWSIFGGAPRHVVRPEGPRTRCWPSSRGGHERAEIVDGPRVESASTTATAPPVASPTPKAHGCGRGRAGRTAR